MTKRNKFFFLSLLIALISPSCFAVAQPFETTEPQTQEAPVTPNQSDENILQILPEQSQAQPDTQYQFEPTLEPEPQIEFQPDPQANIDTETSLPEEEPEVVFPEGEMEEMPFVRLRALDKITARTVSFEAQVGSTVTFGHIFIKINACRKRPAYENPESAAFLQIWEDSGAGASEWIFSGWMFASSPALSHMDDPVYDVWVLDCLLEKTPDKQVEGEVREGEGEIGSEEVPAAPQEPEAAPAAQVPLEEAPVDLGD